MIITYRAPQTRPTLLVLNVQAGLALTAKLADQLRGTEPLNATEVAEVVITLRDVLTTLQTHPITLLVAED